MSGRAAKTLPSSTRVRWMEERWVEGKMRQKDGWIGGGKKERKSRKEEGREDNRCMDG